MTRLVIRTAQLNYRGPGRLDITRGKGEGIGLAFAPSERILWPAIRERADAEALEKAAKSLEEGDPARERLMADAERGEAEAWKTYRRLYLAEMLVSGARPTPRGWGRDVQQALDRGVVAQPEAWWSLPSLAGPDGLVLTCFCGRKWAALRHCHRFLLSDILSALGCDTRGEVVAGTGTTKLASNG